MRKCIVCGGDLEKTAGGDYQCVFCLRRYPDEEERTSARGAVSTGANKGVDIFEQNRNGVLEITCRFSTGVSAGSGFLIDGNGHAITNTHVVTDRARPCGDISVKIAGETVRASVLVLGDDRGGQGNGVDLALIKLARVPFGAQPARFGDFSEVRNGEQVFVIGNSLGDGMCITGGIVSDRKRVLQGKTLLMTDCAVNGGNSGGPIFNGKGEVIGAIVSSRVHQDGSATEGMNYAIPSYIVQEFLSGKHTAVKVS